MNTIKQQAKKMLAVFLALAMMVPLILTDPVPLRAEEEPEASSYAAGGEGEGEGEVTYYSRPKVTVSDGESYTISEISGVSEEAEVTSNESVTDNKLTVTFNVSPNEHYVITEVFVSTNATSEAEIKTEGGGNPADAYDKAAVFQFEAEVTENTVSKNASKPWAGYTYEISAATKEKPFVTENGVSLNGVTLSANGNLIKEGDEKTYLNYPGENTLEFGYDSVTPNEYTIKPEVLEDGAEPMRLDPVTQNETGDIYTFSPELGHFYTIEAYAEANPLDTSTKLETVVTGTNADQLTVTYSGEGVTDNQWKSDDLTITLASNENYSISSTPTITSNEIKLDTVAMTKSGNTYFYTVSAGKREEHEGKTVGFSISANAEPVKETVTWHYQVYDAAKKEYTNNDSLKQYVTVSPNSAAYLTAFTFSAGLTAEGAKLYTVNRVAYGSDFKILTKNAAGLYTVPEGKVTGNLDIWIALEPISERTVTINKKTNNEGFGNLVSTAAGSLANTYNYKLYSVSGGKATLLSKNQDKAAIKNGYQFLIETAANAFESSSVTAAYRPSGSSAETALTVTKLTDEDPLYVKDLDRYLVSAIPSEGLAGDNVEAVIDATKLYKVTIRANSDTEAGLANLLVTASDGTVLYKDGATGAAAYRTKSAGITFTVDSLKSNYKIESVRDDANNQFGVTSGYKKDGTTYTIEKDKLTGNKDITINLSKTENRNNVTLINENKVETTYEENDLFIYSDVSSNYTFKYRTSDYQTVSDVTVSWKSGASTVTKKYSVLADREYISCTESGEWVEVTVTPKASVDLTITLVANTDSNKVNNLTISENKTVAETGSFLTKGLAIDTEKSRTALYTSDYTKIGFIQDQLVLSMDCPGLGAQVTGATLTYTEKGSAEVKTASGRVDFSKFDENHHQIITLDLSDYQGCAFSLALTTDRLGSTTDDVIGLSVSNEAENDFRWAVTGKAAKTAATEWTVPKYTPYFTFAVEPKNGLKATEKPKITVDGEEIVTVVSSDGTVTSAKLGGRDLKVLPVYNAKTGEMSYTLVMQDEIGNGSSIRILETTEKKYLTVTSNGHVDIDVYDPNVNEEEGWINDNTYQADINSELFIEPDIDWDYAVKTVTVDNGKKTQTIKGFYTDDSSLRNAIGSIVMSGDKKVTMQTEPYASVWGLYAAVEEGKDYDLDDEIPPVEPGTYNLKGTYGERNLEAGDLNAGKTTITGGTASQITGLQVVIGEEDRGKTLKLNYAGADGVLGENGKVLSGSISFKVAKKLESITAYDDTDDSKISKLTVGYGETKKIRIEPNKDALLADGYPEIRFYKDEDLKIEYSGVESRIRWVRQRKRITESSWRPVVFITGKQPSETPEENSFYMYIKSGSAEMTVPVTVKNTTLKTPEIKVTGITDKNLSVALSMPAEVTYEDLTSGEEYWWGEEIDSLYYHVVARNTASENQTPYYDEELPLYPDSSGVSPFTRKLTIPLDAAADNARKVTVTATFCRRVNSLFDYEKYEDIDGFTQTSKTVTTKEILKDPAQPCSMKLQNVKKILYDNWDHSVAKIVYNGGDILATGENTAVTSDNPNVNAWVYNGEILAMTSEPIATSSEKATITVTPKGSVVSKSFTLTVAHAISDLSFANSEERYGEPTITLYKKEGKALTYTLSPVFLSEGAAPYDKKPTVTYYDSYDVNDSMKSYVDFNTKTGKITVKADYTPKTEDEYKLYAVVTDQNGERQAGAGASIRFTSSEPEKAGKLALITSADKGATYTIITGSNPAVTRSVLLNNYTKLVMLNEDAATSGTVKAETLFENYVITDPHYDLEPPAGVVLDHGYLSGVTVQADTFEGFSGFQFGKNMKITATEQRTQKKYTLTLKTGEDVLPADAEVDHLEYTAPDGSVVKSDDDNTLTFYDVNRISWISVVFKDSDGNLYQSTEKPYPFAFKNAKDLKVYDDHQNGYYGVSMKNEVVDKKQKGTFKVSFKTAKTSGSGTKTVTSEVFTIVNDPEELDDPDFEDVNKEKLYAKTEGQSKTLTASYKYSVIKATLPASYYDAKGNVSSAYQDAATLAEKINYSDGADYKNGTLTFDKTITLTGTKAFTIYLTLGEYVDGCFVPKTQKWAWEIKPQAIGKFTPAKKYTLKTSSPELDLAKPGAAGFAGKNYDTNTVTAAALYNNVTQQKENSFNKLFRVVNGTTLTITTDTKVIEAFIKAYENDKKEATKEWLIGYIQLTTNTYNPKNTYLTKVTVSFDGKLSNLQ